MKKLKVLFAIVLINLIFTSLVFAQQGSMVWIQATASADWSARYGPTSVVFDNKMWVIGGYDNISGMKKDVWYSTDGATWTRATASAGWSARYWHASVVFDNKMWVMGGWAGSYKRDVWYSSQVTTLITPNGGEQWPVGSNQTIKWRTTGTGLDHYRLLLSSNSGSTWLDTIVHNVASSETTYNWSVPSLNLATCRVMVQVLDTGSIVISNDSSDTNFTIGTAVTIVFPNGGESLPGGSNQIIKWRTAGSGFSRYRLLFYLISAPVPETLSNNIASTETTYNWLVPLINVYDGRIKVQILDSLGVIISEDSSDADFKIRTLPTIVSPNGGEIWIGGSNQIIKWRTGGTGFDHYRLFLSRNGGSTYPDTIANNVAVNETTYNWVVLPLNLTTGRVLVQALDAGGAVISQDASNGNFTIQTAVTVVTPNGGEFWAGGSNQVIKWQTVGTGFSRYRLLLCFPDDMTNFPSGWTRSPTTGGWTPSSSQYYSAPYSAKCTPSANYSNNMNVYMTKLVNLTGATNCSLSFYVWINTQSGLDYIQAQYYSGSSWTTAWTGSGSYPSWQRISAYIPNTATQIRFYFHSNSSVVGEGVYIDDVMVAGGTVYGVYSDTIVHNVAATETMYNWLVPTLNLSTSRVMVQMLDAGGAVISQDASDGNFTIDAEQPSAFDLVAPPNGTWSNGNPTFIWHRATDNFALSHYQLCVSVPNDTIRANFSDTISPHLIGVTWTQATPNANWSARLYHTSIAFNNKMWVMGGWDGDYLCNDAWHSTDGFNWTQATANAGWSTRYLHTSVVFDNKIWVIGGHDNISGMNNDVWYSSDGVNWTQATANAGWSARERHTSVVFDNKIWVMGGRSPANYKNDVWYSSDGINWTQATANAGWSARSSHTSVAFDNKIWVMGGSDASGRRNDVWYSADGINWTQATANAGWSTRYAPTSIVFDNKMWMMGGACNDTPNFRNDIWYSSDGVTWTQATAYAGWPGRGWHTSVVFDNKMWVMGGNDASGNLMNDVWYSNMPITPLPEGLQSWLVRAFDRAGNSRQSNQTYTIRVDITPPVAFNLISPSDSIWTTDSSITYSWQASSDAGCGFVKYQLWIDGLLNQDNIPANQTSTNQIGALLTGTHTWQIRAIDSVGNTRISNQTRVLGFDIIPPNAFALLSPSDSSLTIQRRPRFIWRAPTDSGSGVRFYRLYIDGAISVDSVLSPDTSAVPLTALADGQHSWYVRAYDFAGNARNSEDTWRVIIDSTSPTIPNLIAPVNGVFIRDSLPRFWWHKATDNFSGVNYYQLEYSKNKDFTDSMLVNTSDTTYPVLTGLSDTVYYWRVRSVDNLSNMSSWSTVWTFEIDTRAPSTTQLITPLDGVWLNNDSVIFGWYSVNLTESPVRYILQVDTSRLFNSPAIDTTTLRYDTLVISEGIYYWRVRAYDLANNQGVFSNIDSFGVDLTPPSTPSLVLPDSCAILNIQTVNFIWRRATDNLSRVRYYTLQYATSHLFLNPVTLDSIADTTRVSSPLGDSVYYWRVRCKDFAGNISSWSLIRSFRVDTTTPTAPILVAPTNGYLTNNSSITFIWRKSVSTDVRFYTIQYARNSSFTGADSAVRTDTTYTTILTDTTYYWRVRAVDSAGNLSTWSSVWSFELDTRVPNAPTLVSPINGVWFTNTSVIFNWSQVTFDAKSPVRYILQVDTLTTFTTPRIDTTSLVSDTLTLLQDRYYWRVKAYDLAGNEGAFSGRDSFGIDYTAPSIPNLVSPSNSAVLTDSFVRFTWNRSTDNVSGVRNYRIQVANDTNFTNPTDTVVSDTLITLLLRGTKYWHVKAIDWVGNASNWSERRQFTVTGIEEINNGTIPTLFNLYQNMPNPFSFQTAIRYSIPRECNVSLSIYDISGKLVKTLINETMNAGVYTISWNGNDNDGRKVGQGVYFYILKTTAEETQKKMLMLR